MKKVLVTAGATLTPIDQVRAITNIFKGRTGTNIAMYFADNGYEVTLLTSNPGLIPDVNNLNRIIRYQTFDELLQLMEQEICNNRFDIVIHSSAVSDYKVDGVCFQNESGALIELDNSGKISSDFEVLYLRLIKTPKIVDLIREPWGYEECLVKFKLQVGISDDRLLEIAKKSMLDSDADMIVANCLETSKEYAFIVTKEETLRVDRGGLPQGIEEKIRETMQWESE
ncbi:MAG: phosphopantothenoylcysteine decarboxylase [Candidatus Buchananbacteria bacterium]|jgi:phosphopantothenate--cysteine ligase